MVAKKGQFLTCCSSQHMKRKGVGDVRNNFDVSSQVSAKSRFRMIFSLVTQLDIQVFIDHVDIFQTFVQGDLLPGDSHNANVTGYVSSPQGYEENLQCLHCLLKESSHSTEPFTCFFKLTCSFSYENEHFQVS
jgi:hypothetical protein